MNDNSRASQRTFWAPFLTSVALFFLAGCATVSNEANLKKIGIKERVYFGRIYITFNGNSKPRCEIYVNSDLGPVLKVADDNVVVYKTDRQSAQFTKIACYHESSMYYAAWHMHDLNLSKLVRPETNATASYFGDIKIDWKIDEKDTITSAENAPFDEVTPKRIGRVKDSGELTLQIESQYPTAKDVFKSHAASLELQEGIIHKEN